MPLPLAIAGAVAGFGAISLKLATIAATVGLALAVVLLADVEEWAWRGLDWLMANRFGGEVGQASTWSVLGDMGEWFWWVCRLFAIWDGLALFVSALLCRFLIRRLPVIG